MDFFFLNVISLSRGKKYISCKRPIFAIISTTKGALSCHCFKGVLFFNTKQRAGGVVSGRVLVYQIGSPELHFYHTQKYCLSDLIGRRACFDPMKRPQPRSCSLYPYTFVSLHRALSACSIPQADFPSSHWRRMLTFLVQRQLSGVDRCHPSLHVITNSYKLAECYPSTLVSVACSDRKLHSMYARPSLLLLS